MRKRVNLLNESQIFVINSKVIKKSYSKMKIKKDYEIHTK